MSGGYLLLVLGVYVPILGGIDAFKEALKAADMSAAMDPAMGVVLPVGIGVVVGVVAVSNVVKLLLTRYETPTLGLLLGLLVGAIVGLWPFQHGVQPAIGDLHKGQVLTAELLATVEPEDWPMEFFSPSAAQVAAAIGIILAGFAVTALVARFGGDKE